MALYILISIILILGSVMFFDFEFSQLRGSRGKVGGQAVFALWYTFVTAFAMAIPVILESLSHMGGVGRFLLSCVLYIVWFLFARVLYRYAMRIAHGGTVDGDYRCRVAADDADLVPGEDD